MTAISSVTGPRVRALYRRQAGTPLLFEDRTRGQVAHAPLCSTVLLLRPPPISILSFLPLFVRGLACRSCRAGETLSSVEGQRNSRLRASEESCSADGQPRSRTPSRHESWSRLADTSTIVLRRVRDVVAQGREHWLAPHLGWRSRCRPPPAAALVLALGHRPPALAPGRAAGLLQHDGSRTKRRGRTAVQIGQLDSITLECALRVPVELIFPFYSNLPASVCRLFFLLLPSCFSSSSWPPVFLPSTICLFLPLLFGFSFCFRSVSSLFFFLFSLFFRAFRPLFWFRCIWVPARVIPCSRANLLS